MTAATTHQDLEHLLPGRMETPMTANPVTSPPVAVVTTPRLGHGVRWSDVTREIELDEVERQARISSEKRFEEAS